MNTSRLLLIGLLVVGFCIAFVPTTVCAETIVHTASVPLSSTNWSDSITIPKFDLAGCYLDSVCFSLDGHVEGLAMFESLDAAPTTVTMNLQATIALERPDNTPLATVIPLAQTSDEVTAFDGVTDFAGTSGRTYSDLSGDETESACTTDPADFALFTGTGDITLPAEATGSSFGSGAGNLVLQFNTSASVGVTVTYYYECASPVEGSTWGCIKALYH